jgi:hypothetical protein
MAIVTILVLRPYGKTRHRLSCLKSEGPIYIHSARDLGPVLVMEEEKEDMRMDHIITFIRQI